MAAGEKAREPARPGDLVGQLPREMIRFALVGSVATGTHYLVALLAARHIGVYSANLLGYLAAIAVSYFGHQRYSFRIPSRDISHTSQLPRFALGSLTGLALSYLILTLARQIPGMPDWLALALAAGLVPVYAFFFNKHYVFQTRAGAQRRES